MSTNQTSTILVPNQEEPIRSELFSLERLEQHAESLAAAQVVLTETTRGRPLIPRVVDNGRVLLSSYRSIARAIQKEHAITPAAEWLVDNFHIVDEQLREIQDDLPTGYYRRLPKLASGHLQGYPRVFGVAWAFVAHTDSRFDPEALRRFVAAYQRVQPLTIGELWAVAITLRVVLVENLRRMAERMVSSREARREADALADSLLGPGGRSAILPALERLEKAPLDTAFAVQLVQRLRDLDPKVGPVLLWLDQRLAVAGTSADEIVRAEHQEQGAMSVSVRNIITSMRLISEFDWKEFFESVSLVDEVLRHDTHFADMDFSTRDDYRHAIENLSRGSSHSEIEVARRVVRRVQQEIRNPNEDQCGASSGASNGARLSPDLTGAPGLRTRARFSRFLEALAAPLICPNCGTGLSGLHCRCNRNDSGVTAVACPRGRHDHRRPLTSRFACRGACLGPGDRSDQPRGDGFARAAKAPANGTAPRHPRGLANDCGHAHAAYHRGGSCRARRTAGSALPGKSGWRLTFCAALGLARRTERDPAG